MIPIGWRHRNRSRLLETQLDPKPTFPGNIQSRPDRFCAMQDIRQAKPGSFLPVIFGNIAIVTNVGGVTPPVGIFAYVLKGVAPDIPLHVIFKGGAYFLGSFLIGEIILIVFPEIVLFLPKLMY